MVNIKISELNELETKHNNDLLAIVDSVNNETKKIKVENLVSDNVELKLISDTQPTGLTHGDKYYNTTTNKIYVYVGSGEYVDLGEPKEGILYILFDTQESYAYNGTTLVKMGDGTGVVDYTNTTNKPQINGVTLSGNKTSQDLGLTGLTPQTTYNTSTSESYACSYANNTFQTKGTVLWTNSNPSSAFEGGTITLSSNDYDYIEIIYNNYKLRNTYESTRVYKEYPASEIGGTFNYEAKVFTGTRPLEITNNGNKISFENAYGSALDVYSFGTHQDWYIPQKIIGYKN